MTIEERVSVYLKKAGVVILHALISRRMEIDDLADQADILPDRLRAIMLGDAPDLDFRECARLEAALDVEVFIVLDTKEKSKAWQTQRQFRQRFRMLYLKSKPKR